EGLADGGDHEGSLALARGFHLDLGIAFFHLPSGEGVPARPETHPAPAPHPEDATALLPFAHEEDGGGLSDLRRGRRPLDPFDGLAHGRKAYRSWENLEGRTCTCQACPRDHPHPRPDPRLHPARRARAAGDRRALLSA